MFLMMTKTRTFKEYLLLYGKGVAMGAADVVPGVSGGTIAFISGIYEELIHSIKESGNAAKVYLLKGKFKAFYEAINGNFLVALFAGIATSILLLANVVLYLLENKPVPLWSFFFGLIIASSVIVWRKITAFTFGVILMFVIGVGIAYFVTIAAPAETPTSYWFIFLSGAIAICAMILPGISGSFILLLMGKYEFILSAVKSMKVGIILTFLAGCIIGVSSFSHLLDWLLRRYHNMAVALLSGFMIGSLNKVWPWKQVIETFTDSHGKIKPLVEHNIGPNAYHEITGNQPEVVLAITMAVVGFCLVYFLELIGNKKTIKE